MTIAEGGDMLVTIDKRGSINLPVALRKELGLATGVCLEMTVQDGGAIVLTQVAVYPTVRLSDAGLAKINEARKSGEGTMPTWLRAEIDRAEPDSES